MSTDRHFAHGENFKCLLCFLDQVSAEDVNRANMKIIEESNLSLIRGGLELRLLLDKRELEEPETLLLLCAMAYARGSTAEKIHVLYYLMCSELLDANKFKRFRVKNSHKALRRRVIVLKKTYGGHCEASSTRILYEVSKHPSKKIVSRAALLLRLLKATNQETTQPDIDVAYIEEKRIENEIVLGSKGTNKRLRQIIEHGDASDGPRDKRSSAVLALTLSSNLDDFYAHLLQLYDDTPVNLDELYLHAFRTWIPQLSHGLNRKKRKGVINMLHSLLFISLREKRRFEALQIVNALLHHTSTHGKESWRLLIFQRYLSEEMDVKGFSSDLYQKFVDHLSDADKQVYLTLKFDVLVAHSRFAHALTLTDKLSIPEFHESVAIWLKTVEARLTILLIYMKQSVIVAILLEQLSKLSETSVKAAAGKTISEITRSLLRTVSKRFPIHLPLLKSLAALFLTMILAFEGSNVADLTLGEFRTIKLLIPDTAYAEKVTAVSVLAHKAGNLRLASRLLAALHSVQGSPCNSWEVWCCLGQLEMSRDNPVLGSTYLRTALRLAEKETGKANSFGSCLLFYGFSLHLQGLFEVAEGLYKAAQTIFKSNRNTSMYVLAKIAHAFLLWKSEAFEAAITVLQEAEEVLDSLLSIDRNNTVTLLYSALLATYGELGEMDKADYYFHQKLKKRINETRVAEGTTTIKAVLAAESWAVWRMTIAKVADIDLLDAISICLLPFPSTGEENVTVDEKTRGYLKRTWSLKVSRHLYALGDE